MAFPYWRDLMIKTFFKSLSTDKSDVVARESELLCNLLHYML